MSAPRLPAGPGEPLTIRLPAEIDVSSAPGAELDLMAALWTGASVVIADLTGTVFCDGTGARVLTRAHLEAMAAGADLRIAASPPVRQLLSVTGLDAGLSVYPTVSAALAGVPPGEPNA